MIIRINLHPQKKVKTKSSPALGMLFVCLAISGAVLVVFYLLAQDLDTETQSIKSQEAKVTAEINAINERIKDISTIRANITELENRQKVLAKLASNRVGPQFVLNELARLMSNPKDVISRKEANELGWLMAWEPENISLNTFKDIGNSIISLEGTARSMDDIQEYWTRLKTSPMIRNIKLIEIKDSRGNSNTEMTQSFIFEAEANFNYRTHEGQVLVDELTKETDDKPSQDQAAAKAEG